MISSHPNLQRPVYALGAFVLSLCVISLTTPGCGGDEEPAASTNPDTGTMDADDDEVGGEDNGLDVGGEEDADAEADAVEVEVMGSNSNACLANLGALQPVCPTEDEVSVPTEDCCLAYKAFQDNACGCSPFMDELFGVNAQGQSRLGLLVNGLELFCPSQGVDLPTLDCEAPVAPSGVSSGSAKTYSGGTCPHGDAEMDRLRFRAVIGVSAAFLNAGDPDVCFDTPALIDTLKTLGTPELEVRVPYGIGTYTGYEDAAEYLGIAFLGSNHGFWRAAFLEPDLTQETVLEVSEDGSVWTQGVTTGGSFFDELVTYDDAFLVQDITFEGCETKFSSYAIQPTGSMRDLVESFVQGASLFERWGAPDICRYHTLYCADNPDTKQYESEQECLDFMATLPLYTETCGINRPLAGLSLPCKFKHHFMVPTNPALHCPHIGPPGSHDPNHKLKCDDAYECDDPNQADGWPMVTNIGDNTPQAILDIAAQNNIGAEDELPGCVVPTHP